MGSVRAARHTPAFAKAIVQQYDGKGEVAARLKLEPGKSRNS
jgi:NAD(P)H-dependent FMN reductase